MKSGHGRDLSTNLTSLTYPGSVGSVTRAYDPDNRLKTVSDWLSHTTSFGYDPNSNLTTETYPNSITASFGYNQADQPTGISDTRNGSPVWTFGYTRDAMGQVYTASDPVDSSSHTYGYNQLNQLSSDQQAGGTLTWSYDAADQLKTTTNGVTGVSSSAGYDAGGQLQSYSQTGPTGPLANLTVSFNANGDRTGSSDSVTGTSKTYGYDQADELTSYSSGSTSASYGYNGDGLRMSKTVNGTTTNQVWDLAEGLPTIIQDRSTKYITGPGGLPIEQVAADGSVLSYLQDQLGSTRGLTDSSGSIIATFSYDAYGNLTSSTGTATTPFFGYAGQYTDSESGLQYLQARYYDPQTAQFLTADPLVNTTLRPYGYAADNPANLADPSGLCAAQAGSSGHCKDPATWQQLWSWTKGHPGVVGAALGIAAVLVAALGGETAAVVAGTLAAGAVAADLWQVGSDLHGGNILQAAGDSLNIVSDVAATKYAGEILWFTVREGTKVPAVLGAAKADNFDKATSILGLKANRAAVLSVMWTLLRLVNPSWGCAS